MTASRSPPRARGSTQRCAWHDVSRSALLSGSIAKCGLTARSDREIDRQQGRALRTSTARRHVRGAAVCDRLIWHGDFGDSPGVEKNRRWPTAPLEKKTLLKKPGANGRDTDRSVPLDLCARSANRAHPRTAPIAAPSVLNRAPFDLRLRWMPLSTRKAPENRRPMRTMPSCRRLKPPTVR